MKIAAAPATSRPIQNTNPRLPCRGHAAINTSTNADQVSPCRSEWAIKPTDPAAVQPAASPKTEAVIAADEARALSPMTGAYPPPTSGIFTVAAQ